MATLTSISLALSQTPV